MDEKISFTEGLQKFRIVNAINYYLEDRPKHNLHYTTELVLLYLDDKVSSEDKRKKMNEKISNLEEEIETVVRENIRNITKNSRKEAFQCARSHLEKLPCLEDPLEVDLEYWCMISDIRGMETLYDKEMPEKKNNLDFISLLKLSQMAMDLICKGIKLNFKGRDVQY